MHRATRATTRAEKPPTTRIHVRVAIGAAIDDTVANPVRVVLRMAGVSSSADLRARGAAVAVNARHRAFLLVAAAVAVLLAITLPATWNPRPANAAVPGAPAAPPSLPDGNKRVPTHPLASRPAAHHPAPRFTPEPVVWPTGTATADLAATPTGGAAAAPARAGALPIWLTSQPPHAATNHSSTKASPPATVLAGRKIRVAFADRARTDKAGILGSLFSVTDTGVLPAPGGPAKADAVPDGTPVTITLSYDGFEQASGGDYANRLRLYTVPACALTTPSAPACQLTALPTSNNAKKKTLTAAVPAGQTPHYYAAAAAVDGNAGTFAATSLSPSATWSAGGSGGGFNWSYPLRVPPSVGGQAPSLALGYSSSSVDGRVAATNNQPSWIGDGFDLRMGYIERRYQACTDDMTGGNQGTTKTGDLCWQRDNATISLNGKATELVHDANHPDVWKLRVDDGTRVQHKTGTSNGDLGETGDTGEWWIVTTPDGTQYWFGKNQLPGWTSGKPETNSTDTVPVFGNHTGEPCNKSTYAASWCWQAYRWNLDYILDPNGNAQAYYYTKEFNYYGLNLKPASRTAYIAGDYLTKIEYGFRDGSAYTTGTTTGNTGPTAQISFDVAERCIPSGSVTCAPSQLNATTKNSWPDVPFDRICPVNTDCTNRLSPAFFTRKMLAKITTRIWDTPTVKFRDVDSWTLGHSFPSPGDTSPNALWLDSITHTGMVGGTATIPAVTFDSIQMPNRVDGLGDCCVALNRRRISAIHNETGGTTSITYSPKQCVRGKTMPASPDSNTYRCFPSYWQAPDATEPTLDWFHKYVVTQVTDADGIGLAPTMVTNYAYDSHGVAWHWDDDELSPWKWRTWSEYRGYETVTTTKGETGQTQSSTMTRYFRGMDSDRKANGTTPAVNITDTDGGTTRDAWPLEGLARETVTYDGAGGPILSGTITDQGITGPTATENKDGRGGINAYMVNPTATRTRTALAAGGWRRTQTTTTYNAYGQPTQLDNQGDTATTTDDQCTRTTYVPNTTAWLTNYPSRVETVAKNCATTPNRPDDIITDVITSYDNHANTDPPSAGNPTNVEKVNGWDTNASRATYLTTATHTYDLYGRLLTAADAKNNKTTTSYLPTNGGPVTATTVTNMLGFTAVTTLEPAWGQPLYVIDANNERTDATYDPLGRLTQIWNTDHSKANYPTQPNIQYNYLVRSTAPSAVTTQALLDSGAYLTSRVLYDGFLRTRQTQSPSSGGRLITDTVYDSRGLTKATKTYADSNPVDTTIASTTDNLISDQTITNYDGAERPVLSALLVYGQEKWHTSTAYGGDRVTTTPPQGGTPTTTINDAQGRTIELRQFHTTAANGPYDSTTYTYDPRGNRAIIKDPVGNTWSYHYDIRGRQISSTDPDRGTTRTTYDDLDRPATITDGRGQTVANVYDALGRRTELRDDTATGALRASWTYDTLAKGQLSSSTRFDNGNAYTISVTGYDNAYRPLGTTYTIPDSEGSLAGSYSFKAGYTMTGRVGSQSYPKTPGLNAETVTTSYNNFGQPNTLNAGATPYISSTQYTDFGELQKVSLNSANISADHSFSYEIGTHRLNRTRVVSLDVTGGPVIEDKAYSYDDAGNVTRLADAASTNPDTQCFRNDYLQRLVESWTPASGDCAIDAASAPLGGAAPYWQSFAYDITGNRISKTDHAAPVPLAVAKANTQDTSPGLGHSTASADSTTTYTYPQPGTAHPHAVQTATTNGTTRTYGYDDAGNTLNGAYADAGATTFTYDAEGNPVTSRDAGGTTTYVYDADGNLLLTRAPAKTTLLLGNTELSLDAGATTPTTTRYYSYAGSTVASRTASSLTWTIADKNGTAQIAIDTSTKQISRRWYTPFGESRTPAVRSAWPNSRGFVDGTVSSATTLTHLGARDYDPATGRFTTADPLLAADNPQQLNGYAYANNSPITSSDPTGLLPYIEHGSDGDYCIYQCGSYGKDGGNNRNNNCGHTRYCSRHPRPLPGDLDNYRRSISGEDGDMPGSYKRNRCLQTPVGCLTAPPPKPQINNPDDDPWINIGHMCIGLPYSGSTVCPYRPRQTQAIAENEFNGLLLLAEWAPVVGPIARSAAGSIARGLRAARAAGAAEEAGAAESGMSGSRVPWQFRSDYPEVIIDGRSYAEINGRLYTRHALDRMTPSGYGTAAGGDYGRSIPPSYVEEVLDSPFTARNGIKGPHGEDRISNVNGSLTVITEHGIVITVITR
ncbi:RHS repeat-associated core domain-containing protein [Fodinicola acaciae]|uniref:RHS repeat-associated core domain-containing protein n=1 Tax=Fodinicola acaciae TaxID=2681555 RepID=UPI0013CFB125|nr:RHS repeat-associated core domain-containing protein [Fodinicola acaciae]